SAGAQHGLARAVAGKLQLGPAHPERVPGGSHKGGQGLESYGGLGCSRCGRLG
ncbi:unnamed protein product, partial [Effrenium voratum]